MNNLSYKEIVKLMIIAFILLVLFFHIEWIYNIFIYGFNILMPFIIGVSLAYILNVPMSKIETLLGNIKGKRIIAIILVLFITILLLSGVIYLVIPELYRNIIDFISSIPNLIVKYKHYFIEISNKYPALNLDVNSIDTGDIKSYIIYYIKNILIGSTKVIGGVVSILFNIFTGVIFAIYILLAKENVIKRTSMICKSCMPKSIYNKSKYVVKVFDDAFNKFIGGQCLECLILGAMIYITLLLLNIPYALTIAVLTTITAIVPIFGSFIAFGIGILLVAFTNPVKAIMFAIAFLVIQQIEGNLIYPKVVGSSVGLSPLYTLLAVVIFGSIFGIIGMIIAVPLTSVILTLTLNKVDKHE